MAIAIALLGFNDLGRSVTPTFLFRNRFYLQLPPQCPNINKKQLFYFFPQEKIARLQQENRDEQMEVRHTAVM